MVRNVAAALIIGGMVAYGSVGDNPLLISHCFANPLSFFQSRSEDPLSGDPFERWIVQIRKDHDDFVATAECRKKLAELQSFWAEEGLTGAKLTLPQACIKKA